MLGWLAEYETSLMLGERLEVKKSSKVLVHKVNGLVQYIAHMVHYTHGAYVHFVCETVIATST